MLLVLLFLVPLLIIVLPKLIQNGKKKPQPPGPRGLPIIGNMHQMKNPLLHEYFTQLSKKYGPLVYLRLASKPIYVVSSASLAKEVLKNQDLSCCGRPLMTTLKRLNYNGIDIAFSTYSEYWREVRKICVLNVLSNRRVQSFRHIREDEVSVMIQRIGALASMSKPANMSEMILSLTTALICRMAFGRLYGDDGNDISRFRKISDGFGAMVSAFFFSDYFPSLGWIDSIIGTFARLERTFETSDGFYQEVVDEHLKPGRPETMKDDLVDVLLQLKEEQSTAIPLTTSHIKALVSNIFGGGTDTTAVTLTWAMTELIKNPAVIKKAQEEVRNLVGKKGNVDEDDVQKLTYLKAVVKEILRMYPALPLLAPHETLERCIIDGYEIQPKSLIYVNTWAIARDPKYWENPEKFLPERFLDSALDYKGQDFQYFPFGSGRRSCPGLALAVVVVELSLANLLYSFDWEVPNGMKIEDVSTEPRPGLTLVKKHDLFLVAKPYA